MSKYTIFTYVGLAIVLITFVINQFLCNIPDTIEIALSWVGAILMLIGLYFRNKEKKK